MKAGYSPVLDGAERRFLEQFVRAAAARVVRVEAATARKLLERHAGEPEHLLEELGVFYRRHEAYVARCMFCPDDRAKAWCDARLRDLVGALRKGPDEYERMLGWLEKYACDALADGELAAARLEAERRAA